MEFLHEDVNEFLGDQLLSIFYCIHGNCIWMVSHQYESIHELANDLSL